MKRKISIASILISISMILLSIEKVTMVGLLEGRCTFYQTISTSGKAYNLVLNSSIKNNSVFIVMFFIAIALLFVPCFTLFKQSKIRSIICIVINTVGTILTFIFFSNLQYMYMLIVICLLITSNILVRLVEKYKEGFDWFVLVVSILIGFVNIYYLVSHLHMERIWVNWYLNGNLDAVVEDMISISRVNMICFCLWIIPCAILFCKEFIKYKEV